MPDLVVMDINGAQSMRIDYSGKSSQVTIGRELWRVAITDAEASLGLANLRILWDGGAFKGFTVAIPAEQAK